jgi:RNA polymerase sigma-70 factor (ECF subfamily)
MIQSACPVDAAGQTPAREQDGSAPSDTILSGCPVDAVGQSLARESGPAALDLPLLYRKHFDLVWRNLRRLGVAEASLDDAVQDVFLVVHRRSSEFQGQSSDKTWIVGIVLRVAHDYRRSQRRHSSKVTLYAQHRSIDVSAQGPVEQAEMREAASLVRTILQGFPEQERNVFVLVELEELSLREAAEAAGFSLATCQRRLNAARKAFDVALRRYDRISGKRADS